MSPTNLFLVSFFSSIILINAQQNCSIYNPCGRNGYCIDNAEGNWTCECKFWWNATLCTELTTSGKQVIVLGSITAFFIIIVYGLQIIQYIQARIHNSKQEKKNDRNLVNVFVKDTKKSGCLSSIVVGCLTVIVAAAALVTKWSLLQPVHNELAKKFLNNDSLYYVPNSFCNILSLQDFNVITFPVACFLIIILIILTKRTSLCSQLCRGFGGLPMPIDFFAHVDRKLAAVVFAICVDDLLFMIQSVLNGTARKGEGIIVNYLLGVFDVLIMGFHYYAILAAVYLDTIVSLTFATLYVSLEYSITILNQGMCKSEFYPTYSEYLTNRSSIDDMLGYYGTGPNLIAIQLCTDIPRYLCFAYINVEIPWLLIRKIYLRRKKNLNFEEKLIMKLTREQRAFFLISQRDSPEMLYVKNLFHSVQCRPRSQALLGRIIPKTIYEWRDDYQFSTRIISLYSSVFLVLYLVTVQACVRILPSLTSISKTVQFIADIIASIFISTSANNKDESTSDATSNFPIPDLTGPYLFAVFLTLTIIIVQLLVLLANIRRNSFQSFRGDVSEIPRRQKSKYVSYATGNVHFAGYFIGYLVWGFIIIATFAALISLVIASFINFGNVRLIESLLKGIIPPLLLVLFKQYLNKVLAQYIFLQHYGQVLSLNNRRCLMIFIYFNFFLDAFLGFVSSIMRLVKSVIGGIIYMCRLDYSPLGRKLETFDGGFSAYCGFIHTECTHRHPVMLVFVSHLYTQRKMKSVARKMMITDCFAIEDKYAIELKHQSRYTRKWKLAVFLTQNPTLVFFRKAFLNTLHIDEIRYFNDIDNDDEMNANHRLSVYTRHMSAARLNDTTNRTRKL